jgi:hypothetical protein
MTRSVFRTPLSARTDRARLVTESAHGVRSRGDSVAPEGGGKQVPTQGGGCARVTAALGSSCGEVAA